MSSSLPPAAPASSPRSSSPTPFARLDDGPVPAHGALLPEPSPAPRSYQRTEPQTRAGSYPSAEPRVRGETYPGERSYPRPEPEARGEAYGEAQSYPSAEPEARGESYGEARSYPQAEANRQAQPYPRTRAAVRAGAGAGPAPAHPGNAASYPPMRRPVRPQVRDEVPMSEPWPRPAPAAHRLASLSQPIPVVGDGYQGGVRVAEYPVVSSRELPVVVAADLLAVEGPGPDVYRYRY